MKNFRELRVWQESRELVKAIYCVAKQMPNSEQFGLISQLQRAVISISANIAEGSGQNSDAQFKRYLNIAYGSASEVSCLLQLSCDLEYIKKEELEKLESGITNIQKMLYGLMKKIDGD